MKKRLCGWCENEVDKDLDLCPKCRKKYEETNKELERIDKEYDELFANYPDCLSQIAFVKGLQKENEILKKQLKEVRKQVCDEIRKRFGYQHNKQLIVSSYNLCKFLDQIEKGEE